MATEVEELHQFDVGTRIISSIVDGDEPVDLSAAIAVNYLLRKPDGSVATLGTSFITDGSDGQIQYTTVSGTFNLAGYYKLQAYIETTTKSWHTDKIGFRVYPNLS